MKKKLFSAIASVLGSAATLFGQGTDKPFAISDLILPITGQNLTSDTWGGVNVRPRYVDNGIEESNTTIWGGNAIKGDDGLYHIFVCAWDEKHGRNGYKNRSYVLHATSANACGPYVRKDVVGNGFDPEAFRMADGTYVVKVWNGHYTSKSLDGPWTFENMKFDARERLYLRGPSKTSLSNMTFAERPDHSYMALDRGGAVWVSKDGLKDWCMITDNTVYSGTMARIKEDPVIWKDGIQYYMMERYYTDCTINFYRSLDGVHWTCDESFDYTTGIVRHADGTKEDWKEFARLKVITDEVGRVECLCFAVCDVPYAKNGVGDGHGCKSVVLPFVKRRLIEVKTPAEIAPETSSVSILVKGEDGFRPAKDLDVASLRLGSHRTTKDGKGLKAVKTRKQGKNDLLVTFAGNAGDLDLDADEWALRMVGKTKTGAPVHAYASRPGFSKADRAILTCMMPHVDSNDVPNSVLVENYGVATSRNTTVKVLDADGNVLATGSVEPIAPFEKKVVSLVGEKNIPTGTKSIDVIFMEGDKMVNRSTIATRNINSFQERLVSLVDSAQTLSNKDKYTEGKMELQMAMMDGLENISRFDLEELIESCKQLEESIADFMSANGVSLEFYDFYTWARNDGARINMSDSTVEVRDGAYVGSLGVIDNISDGKGPHNCNGRIAIQKSSHNFDLRDNGENNSHTGLFDYSSTSYISLRDLTPGMRLTIKVSNSLQILNEHRLYLESDSTQADIAPGTDIVSCKTYVVKGEEGEKVNLDFRGYHYTAIQNIKIEKAVKPVVKANTRKGRRHVSKE